MRAGRCFSVGLEHQAGRKQFLVLARIPEHAAHQPGGGQDVGGDPVGAQHDVDAALDHLREEADLRESKAALEGRVSAVDGRKVTFETSVKDELDEVGAGSHVRFVVDKAKTFERLKAKATKFAAAR